MKKGRFTAKERSFLEALPAVKSVSATRIYYTDEFRQECMRRYANGDSPVAIFRAAGLDPKLIGYKRIERSIARWKQGDAGDTAGDDSAQDDVRVGSPNRTGDVSESDADANGGAGNGNNTGNGAAGVAKRRGAARMTRRKAGAVGGALSGAALGDAASDDASTAAASMPSNGTSRPAAVDGNIEEVDSRDLLIAQQALRISELERRLRECGC